MQAPSSIGPTHRDLWAVLLEGRNFRGLIVASIIWLAGKAVECCAAGLCRRSAFLRVPRWMKTSFIRWTGASGVSRVECEIAASTSSLPLALRGSLQRPDGALLKADVAIAVGRHRFPSGGDLAVHHADAIRCVVVSPAQPREERIEEAVVAGSRVARGVVEARRPCGDPFVEGSVILLPRERSGDALRWNTGPYQGVSALPAGVELRVLRADIEAHHHEERER